MFREEDRQGYLIWGLEAFAAQGAPAYLSTRVGPSRPWDLRERSESPGPETQRDREAFLALFGFQSTEAHRPAQVHGSGLAVVSPLDGPGRVWPGVDGLITTAADLPLWAFFADCVPVFFLAPERAIGLIHAGWRGTAAGILEASLGAFRQLGVAPGELWVALGPHIGAECYIVGPEVSERFLGPYPWARAAFSSAGNLDLTAIQRGILERSGVPPERVLSSATCTGCQTDLFYSHRREGANTGRFAAIFWRRRKRPILGEYLK